MSEINLGRVQGGGFFGSTSTSETFIEKSSVSTSGITPLVGDTIVNANGALCRISSERTGTYDVVKYNSIKGIQGIKGDKGEQGERGVQGIQGIKGDKGDKGLGFTGYIIGERAFDSILLKYQNNVYEVTVHEPILLDNEQGWHFLIQFGGVITETVISYKYFLIATHDVSFSIIEGCNTAIPIYGKMGDDNYTLLGHMVFERATNQSFFMQFRAKNGPYICEVDVRCVYAYKVS